jgi:hypothetical protein
MFLGAPIDQHSFFYLVTRYAHRSETSDLARLTDKLWIKVFGDASNG